MTVSELIQSTPSTGFSFEVLPPLKGRGTSALFRTIDTLREFAPTHINITTHRSEYVYTPQPDGTYVRRRLRRRPGTVAVASAIMQKYDIKVVPHVVCSGASREDIEYMLLDLQLLGISDLLLLRGDKAKDESRFVPEPDGHAHTTDLIGQVRAFNDGTFLDGEPVRSVGQPFSFGVACYPEKHEEAPNPDFDLSVLRMKQSLGAGYAITQMFFDNAKYFDFVRRARAEGITIPIIPGLKPLTKTTQISVVPKTFHLDLPTDLSHALQACGDDEAVRRLGVEWATAQCRELQAAHVPTIHFYTMGATDSVAEIARAIY